MGNVTFRGQQRNDGWSRTPHGALTLQIRPKAVLLLIWLHSHDDRYLHGLSVARVRDEFGAGGSTWDLLSVLASAGFVEIVSSGPGKRSGVVVNRDAYWKLCGRTSPDSGEVTSPTSPDPGEVTSPDPGQVPSPDWATIEEQVEEQGLEEQHTHELDAVTTRTGGPVPPDGGGGRSGPSADNDDGDQTLFALESTPAPKGKRGDTGDDTFEKFWKAYCRQGRAGSKPRAAQAFKAAVKRDGLPAIKAGFKAWTAYWALDQTPAKKRPHAGTWLNQCKYNDLDEVEQLTNDERSGRAPAHVYREHAPFEASVGLSPIERAIRDEQAAQQ